MIGTVFGLWFFAAEVIPQNPFDKTGDVPQFVTEVTSVFYFSMIVATIDGRHPTGDYAHAQRIGAVLVNDINRVDDIAK